MEKQQNNSTFTILGLVIVAGVAIAVTQILDSSRNAAKTNANANTTTLPPTSTGTSVNQGTYKDGEYKVVGNYMSPGGAEEVGVNVTLKGNTITAATIEVKATRPTSKKFQEMFASGYQAVVVGKSIDQVDLGKVSGSSLTPKGFNDALAKIKKEAQL